MSKNTWVMISQPVKEGSAGVRNYVNYLTNPNHKNHQNTNSIFTTFGNDKLFLQSTVAKCSEVDYKNQQAGKGGRPMGSYAQSFVFSLPAGVPQPTAEQWKQITEVIVLDLCSRLKISPKHADKYIFANVHDQAKPDLNITVCKARNGEVFKDLQKKGIIEPLKRAFTVQYQLLTGFSVGDYQRKTTGAKKRLPKPKFEAVKKKKKQKELEEKPIVKPIENFHPNRINPRF